MILSTLLVSVVLTQSDAAPPPPEPPPTTTAVQRPMPPWMIALSQRLTPGAGLADRLDANRVTIVYAYGEWSDRKILADLGHALRDRCQIVGIDLRSSGLHLDTGGAPLAYVRGDSPLLQAILNELPVDEWSGPIGYDLSGSRIQNKLLVGSDADAIEARQSLAATGVVDYQELSRRSLARLHDDFGRARVWSLYARWAERMHTEADARKQLETSGIASSELSSFITGRVAAGAWQDILDLTRLIEADGARSLTSPLYLAWYYTVLRCTDIPDDAAGLAACIDANFAEHPPQLEFPRRALLRLLANALAVRPAPALAARFWARIAGYEQNSDLLPCLEALLTAGDERAYTVVEVLAQRPALSHLVTAALKPAAAVRVPRALAVMKTLERSELPPPPPAPVDEQSSF